MILSIIFALIAGAAWGMRERYHAEPRVFERLMGVEPEGWAGSKAWKRAYVNNDPGMPHKFGPNTFRDIWHFTGTLAKLLLVAACVLACSKGLVLVFALYALHALIAHITYIALE
ncbi:MAG: hypothetical protein KatS3mg031_2887 [Chitinophagales bacterium]|nr:MAG: hypothetical protein KatS3mg031_2887 [Chitinophagales bacterium]